MRGTAEKERNTNESFMTASFCLEAMKDNAVATYSTHNHQDINEIGAGMWLIDSGCNKHISPFRKDFKNVRETDITCTFGNKGQIKAEGIGEVEINILGMRKNDPKLHISRVTLKNVLYVPDLSIRLLSSGCLRRAGGKFVESNVSFTPDGGVITRGGSSGT